MKELVLSIMGFVLLLAVFCIVILTSSWTDERADEHIGYSCSAIKESKPDSATQGPINHFSEISKESEPDATFSDHTYSNADKLEPAFASPHYRINYHRSDPNDFKDSDNRKDSLDRKNSFARKGSDARKNDSEDAADVVE
jgi:hypothetical protein